MLHIFPINAFKDNYIWCIENQHTKKCVVVDPGDAKPVKELLASKHLILEAILITHHHWDHTNGILELIKSHAIPVYGPINSNIPGVSIYLDENDPIEILNELRLQVLTVPGHTLDHIAYFGQDILFCGDTLFSAGCGRLFEGTAEQMYHSLAKLSQLPAQTRVYCAHEYTLANLQFAKLVEPDNNFIHQYLHAVKQLQQKRLPTLPSTIAQEKMINPFLRSHEVTVINSVKQYANRELSNPIDTFKYTRIWKDNFRDTT